MRKLKRIKSKIRYFCDVIKSVADGKWDFCVVAADLIYCKLRFKVSVDEYLKYDFHKYKNRYRKYFFLNKHRRWLGHVNAGFFTKSKYIFYKRIPELYKREILLAPYCGEEEFVAFLKRHKEIIIKPDDGSYGMGIALLTFTDEEAAKQKFASFSKQAPTICEEVIRQHEDLQGLNPFSVNSIRIISILRNDEVEIVSATLKCGAKPNTIIDNMVSGGIAAQVDVANGIVHTYGVDYAFNTYTHHPVTGKQIIGFNIPNWGKVVDCVKQAHKCVPQCMLYGWDIAVTQDGADIVEANSVPGWRITQVTDKIPKGTKVLPYIKKDVLKQGNPKYVADYSAFEKGN